MARRCVAAGCVVGSVAGFGFSGFWWMNPYVALTLCLGGGVLLATAMTAASKIGLLERDV